MSTVAIALESSNDEIGGMEGVKSRRWAGPQEGCGDERPFGFVACVCKTRPIQSIQSKRASLNHHHFGAPSVMSTIDVLTKEVAEDCFNDNDLYLNQFTAIDDDAAECLSEQVCDLQLDGLTFLSDAAAESLSKHLE